MPRQKKSSANHKNKNKNVSSDGHSKVRMHRSKKERTDIMMGNSTSSCEESSSSSQCSSISESLSCSDSTSVKSCDSSSISSSCSSESSRRHGAKKHRRRGGKGYGSYGKAPKKAVGSSAPVREASSKSKTALISGAPTPKATMTILPIESAGSLSVRPITAEEHDSMNLKQVTYRFHIADSLDDLAKATIDSAGNEQPLSFYPGKNINIISGHPDILARAEALRLNPAATIQAMEENPSKFFKPDHIVTSVYVTGHSEMPQLQIKLDNIRSNSHNLSISEAEGGPTQSLVINCEAGNKLNRVRVLKNHYTADDVAMFKRYSASSEADLDAEPHNERSINDVPMISVEYSNEKPHIVIDEIRRSWIKDARCTEEHRNKILAGSMPQDVISRDKNRTNIAFVPRDIYNDYREKCITALRRNRPLSDVAHPFGLVTRAVSSTTKHFRDANVSAMDSESEKKQIWTHPLGLTVGTTTERSKDTATKKVRGAWMDMTVNFASLADLQ